MKGLLQRAIENKENVQIIYLSEKGELTQRIITVINVNDRHVTCYCHTRGQRRMFKLVNILSAQFTRKREMY
ncbi:WYL domain-containing protein [Bacillus sp. FJAT-45037]|uniref:WYL domain-containing protein n=1 Tax=Bacillus sp. FJAT-45037 TaxID=2011007 RepID=UPI000C24661A